MSQRKHDRGMVYLLVLVTAGVTVSMGMLAVFAAAAQREVQELAIERERAALRAEAGIQIALAAIESNDAWRSAAGGRVVARQTMNRGELSVVATDADGVLDDEATDPFTLTATATYGRAKQRVAADAQYLYDPIEALNYTIVAAGGLINNHKLMMSVGGVELLVEVDKVDPFSPWLGKSMADIEIPSTGIIEKYASIATPVPIAASKDGKGLDYEELMLSSKSASSKELAGFTVNEQGIYLIDGRGQEIYVKQPNVVGTLVIVNATSVRVQDPEVLRAGPDGNPVLLVQGVTELDGLEEGKTDETYPDDDDSPEGPDFDDPTFDGVQGLIYVDGPIRINGHMTLHGTLISTDVIDVNSDVFIRRNDAFLDAPPPGYRTGLRLDLVAGSWRTIVD